MYRCIGRVVCHQPLSSLDDRCPLREVSTSTVQPLIILCPEDWFLAWSCAVLSQPGT